MIEKLNDIILEKILTEVPGNIKPVNYLMDILDIGKESAYRRLRGEKSFSFDEVSLLSGKLDFSIDEIIRKNTTNTAIFTYSGQANSGPEDSMLDFLQYYRTYLDRISEADDSKIILTMNHLFYVTILRYDNMFKFAYYRWMHQMKEVPLNYMYADIVIDKRISDVRKSIIGREHNLKYTSYIIDKNLFLNMIKEIQYFYKRGLISKDELDTIKTDFHSFMADAEKTLIRGIDRNGNTTEIYLSTLSIDSNTIYATSNGRVESSFWLGYGHPVRTTNNEITARHKYWIDSLKKYTMVISNSNESEQADFFNHQREYLNNIAKDIRL